MKLASFTYKSEVSFGVVTENGVIDLMKKFNGEYKDLKSFIEHNGIDDVNIDTNKSDYSISEIEFLPVIPKPDKIICVGLNYHEHLQEVGRKQTEDPVIFYE